MSGERKVLLEQLDRHKIAYTLVEHPAVYTMEEMAGLSLPGPAAKNLFLRDSKGKRHFLVVLAPNAQGGEKRADLAALGEKLATRLSFASEERLERYLGLKKGAVSPLGILKDESRSVEVLLDAELKVLPLVGFHPGENTATVFLSPLELAELLEEHGNPLTWVELP